MYKEIDQEFIVRTLRTYDARTLELRREMSTQYTLLNTQTLDVNCCRQQHIQFIAHRRLGIRWIVILMRSTRDT